ncbi:MAG TPA: peptidoglycan DD-metalloendopeptidase family protein [Ramlibacter sp.]|uniref:peptidoglycan DD-metalloendopeptidase family protein n=1 Tax=Ramlibacter sp. TaxID=1917967 RepID=UPI002B96DD42|nr:peptidoglycan DD-metalloendopeptidase family protein [Ramlibacter sp.]HVZ44410.1 peptidoglycan DD-metalloendopeptidase family protein [Ramlibacter sp.]
MHHKLARESSALQAVVVAALAAMVMAGCASSHRAPAPVEDRTGAARMTAPAPQETAKPLPGAENAGKPGYYTVRPGDTLIRIALESGQNWRDLQRWNGLDNPNVIEVGQVLRVIPPAGAVPGSVAGEGVVTKPVTTASAATAPLPAAPATSAASASAGPSRATTAAAAPSLPPVNTPPVAPGDDDVSWVWPTPAGPIVAGFDEQKNKGIDIGGKAGEPVVAAADGRVVYAGAGLRGYGNLVILKHNNTYLSAYAHNQSLLVKEDQAVKKGQKIAEMGSSDADRVKLHFEIRRQGKPVDPTRYLPPR